MQHRCILAGEKSDPCGLTFITGDLRFGEGMVQGPYCLRHLLMATIVFTEQQVDEDEPTVPAYFTYYFRFTAMLWYALINLPLRVLSLIWKTVKWMLSKTSDIIAWIITIVL